MKKIILILSLAILLTACQEKTEIRGGVEHFEGYRTFTSEALGFQFDYPSSTYNGRKVAVKEYPPVEADEIGIVSAGFLKMWVRKIEEPSSQEERVAYLNELKIAGIENCRLDLDNKSTDEREEYHFIPTKSAEAEDIHEKCKIYYSIYYFPEKPGQYLEISGNDKLPFNLKDSIHFFDSIAVY